MTTPDHSLADSLRTLAVCRTSHPADAVGALVHAAASILTARFAPEEIAELLAASFRDAVQAVAGVALAPIAAEAAPAGEGELVRTFLSRAIEQRSRADDGTIACAMIGTAIALVEARAGTTAAIELAEGMTARWRAEDQRAAPPAGPAG